MSKIVGAFVKKSMTTSAKAAQQYAADMGKATGAVRQTSEGFAIGSQQGRRVEAGDGLTVFVE